MRDPVDELAPTAIRRPLAGVKDSEGDAVGPGVVDATKKAAPVNVGLSLNLSSADNDGGGAYGVAANIAGARWRRCATHEHGRVLEPEDAILAGEFCS